MTTQATTFSGHIKGQEAAYKTFAKPNYQQRFRYFIEHSDWEEEFLAQEEWINKLCFAVIIVASLCFIPHIVVMLFLL
jgi:hypothetical protein